MISLFNKSSSVLLNKSSLIRFVNKPLPLSTNKITTITTTIHSRYYTSTNNSNSNIKHNNNQIKKLIEFKNGEIKYQYSINNSNNQIKLIKSNNKNNSDDSDDIIDRVQSYFLPKGFPNSVSPDYAKYYQWIFFQNVVGSVTYVLSTYALLTTVVGMSTEAALPFAAAISWVLKDGLGAFALVFFANKFSTLFDHDLKRYKFRGDILHNLGVLLEMCTPFIQSYFLPIASISNLSKGLAGLIYGSTRASLNKSFSIKDNIGDITAKYQSQSMVAYLMGMSIGSSIGLLIGGNPTTALSMVFMFSFVHMFLGYKATKSIKLKSLNKQRLSIIIDNWLSNNNEILSSNTVNDLEEFIFSSKYSESPIITLGASIGNIENLDVDDDNNSNNNNNNNNLQIIKSIHNSKLNNNNDYFITVNNNKDQISVYYLINSNNNDNQSNNNNNSNNNNEITQLNQNIIYIKSFFHSHIIRNEINNSSESTIEDILTQSQEMVNEKFDFFINDLVKSNQWNINTTLMIDIGESKFKFD